MKSLGGASINGEVGVDVIVVIKSSTAEVIGASVFAFEVAGVVLDEGEAEVASVSSEVTRTALVVGATLVSSEVTRAALVDSAFEDVSGGAILNSDSPPAVVASKVVTSTLSVVISSGCSNVLTASFRASVVSLLVVLAALVSAKVDGAALVS